MPSTEHNQKSGKWTLLLFAAARLWRFFRRGHVPLPLLLAGLSRPSRSGTEPTEESSLALKAKDILVISLDAMGDLVMTTPLFHELKRTFPDCRITAVVRHSTREVLETNPHVDRIVSPAAVGGSRLFLIWRTEYAVLRLYREMLRGQRFAIALHPRLGPDYYGSDLLLCLVHAPMSIRYEQVGGNAIAKAISRYVFRYTINLPRPPAQLEVLSKLDLMRPLIKSVREPPSPEVFLTSEEREDVGKLIAEDSFSICLAFGAQARRRMWPISQWETTIALIAMKRPVSVLILCASSDAPAAERLRALLEVPAVIVQGARLRHIAALLERSNLFLGADSGLAHLAAAMRCPCVVVSPHPLNGDPLHENSPVRFRPWGQRVRVVQPPMSMSPCESGCNAIRPHCILLVNPAEVAAAAEELLTARSSSQQLEKLSAQDSHSRLPITIEAESSFAMAGRRMAR